LPSVTLHCREKGEDYSTALNEAFLALTRQINKYKDKLVRERRRTERRAPRP
jgi:ribosome-associated translation inhibitor RaiA